MKFASCIEKQDEKQEIKSSWIGRLPDGISIVVNLSQYAGVIATIPTVLPKKKNKYEARCIWCTDAFTGPGITYYN